MSFLQTPTPRHMLHTVRTFALLLLTAFTLLTGMQPARAAEVITYFHNDATGTPQLATDADGNVVWKETYRPYGERINRQAGASSNNALWYTGKPQDPHSGLVYMGARYYEPVLGRFLGIDPAGFDEANLHSFNRYAYGNNNPYKYVDPDGRNPLLVWAGVGALTGGLAAGAMNAATQYLATGQIDWGVYGVGGAAAEGAQMGMVLGPAGFVAGARAGSVARAEVAAAKGAGELSFGRKLDFLFNKGIDQSNAYNAARAAGNAERIGITDTAANRAEVTRLFNQAFRDPSSIVGPGKLPGSNVREFFLPGVTGTGSKIQFVEQSGKVITIIAK